MEWNHRLGAALALGAFTVGLAHGVEPEKKDPKLGVATYFGTGKAESAPELGEVFITFNVACLGSAEAVAQAIDATSAPIWKAIAEKVPTKNYSETDRTFWNSIVTQEQEGSTLTVVAPNPKEGVRGSAKRVNNCTGKQIDVESDVPATFSGSQTIGVRSSDLDWVDGLARALNERPQKNGKTDVKVSHGGVRYDVKAATKAALLEKVLASARDSATGAGSQFESDQKTLKFTNAYFLGHKVASGNPFDTARVGQALARGLAPKVTVDLPLVYTVYAEAADRIGTGKAKGLETQYEVQGSATVDADYGTTTIGISVACQATKEAAAKTLEASSKDLMAALTAFQGQTPATEKDKIVDTEASAPSADYPYQAIGFSADGKKVEVYLDKCTLKKVAAPESGSIADLPPYFVTSRRLELRSSKFDALLTLVEGLQKKHARPQQTSEVKITVGNAYGAVVEATKQKLALTAREQATKGVLAPSGPLAADVAAHKFLLAHLKSVRPGRAKPVNAHDVAPSGFGGAHPEAAMAAAPQAAPIAVQPVVKPGESRPTYVAAGSYVFEFEFLSENYVGPKPVKKDLP